MSRATSETAVSSGREADVQASLSFIDCDVHATPRNADEVKEYMDEPWRSRFSHAVGERKNYVNPGAGLRVDAQPSSGGRPGSDPGLLREQLVEEHGAEHAILLVECHPNMLADPDFASAIAAAHNEWMADTWLGKYNADGVFKGSINVAPQDPEQAVREIERWAGHPHIVQVMTNSGAQAPYGQRRYWPIYEACARHNLPLAIHAATDAQGINYPVSNGYPTHYIEWRTDQSLSMAGHLVSIITEGVFEKYPNFRLAMVEGGAAWFAPILWRLESNWKALRFEVPWMTRRPQDYVRDHIRITSQPLEDPGDRKHFLHMLEMMDAENVLMFSSDYPHWDFDSPTHILHKLPEPLRSRVASENAREFYGL